MSAQVSPILSRQGNEVVKNTNDDKVELLVNPSNAASTPVDSEKQETPIAKEQTSLNNASNEQNNLDLEEVNVIQQAILIDDNFDFSQLEAPAAGQTNTIAVDPLNNGHLSTVSLIENSNTQIEFHIQNQETAQALDGNPSLSIELGTESGDNLNFQVIEENTLLDIIPKTLGSSQGNTTEDFKIELQGQADTNYQFVANTHDTSYGSITYNEQGQWQYQLDNQSNLVQSLGAGDTLTDSIQLISKSGASYSLDITINGTNDQAILSGDKIDALQTLSNTEQTALELDGQAVLIESSGQLSVQDNDTGEARFVSDIDIPSTYGSASITALGDWTYTLNHDQSAVTGLTTGEHLIDYFSVKTLDGTSQLIQITINGTDDKPYLGGGNLANLELTQTTEVEGVLTINDPDFGQSHFQAESSIKTNFGFGSIDEDGHWSYQVDSDNTEIQTLDDGERLVDTFSIYTADGTEQTIIIPIGNGAFIPDTLQASTAQTSSMQISDLLIDSEQSSELDTLLETSFGTQSNDVNNLSNSEINAIESAISVNNLGLASGNTENDVLHQLIQQGTTDIV